MRAERIHEISRKMAALEGYGESSKGFIAAVVGVRHDLRSLRIDPRVYREPDACAIANDIVAAIRVACVDVDRQARALAGPLLSDGDDPFLRALDELTGTHESR
jgi:DNA-binding protein YbaB